jgi:hypothetical protein
VSKAHVLNTFKKPTIVQDAHLPFEKSSFSQSQKVIRRNVDMHAKYMKHTAKKKEILRQKSL